jgi:hypothetical protein
MATKKRVNLPNKKAIQNKHIPKKENFRKYLYGGLLILTIAFTIYAYFISNTIFFISGICLTVLSLVFYVLSIKRKRPTENNEIKKGVSVQSKQETRIDTLLEKEHILEGIKQKRRIMLYTVLLLFSIAPLYTGYQNLNYITLVLGTLLLVISIGGLVFSATSKLKNLPAAEVKSTPKSDFKISPKFYFVAGVVALVGAVNLIIFVFPDALPFAGAVFGLIIFFGVVIFLLRKKKASIPEKTLDEDVRKILQITDELLASLPEDQIKKFANSKDFELYEAVLTKYKIK